MNKFDTDIEKAAYAQGIADVTRGLDLQAMQREAAAIGWDAAIEAMRHEDGSPVELIVNQNPFREVEEL